MIRHYLGSTLLLCLYALLMYAITFIIVLLRPLLPKWKNQLSRPLWQVPPIELQQPACVIYCSSAGEYEQAKPLLDRLTDRGFFPVIIFFSVSGYNYARRRNESLACVLAPVDHPLAWRHFFKIIQPKFTVIVRHEFWPAFVCAASKYSSLYVINYSAHDASRSPGWLTKALLTPVRRIFTIGSKDRLYLAQRLQFSQALETNDTKFDRVLERADQQKTTTEGLKVALRTLAASRHIVVLGSAWKEDVSLILSGWRLLEPQLQEQYYFVIIPHDIGTPNLEILRGICSAFQTEAKLYSQSTGSCEDQNHTLIVDTMGKLAEVYAAATSCFVGGGLHHRVHNVLEPAAYNLDIAFGPRYETQREAQTLVDQGLVTVCQTPHESAAWLTQTKQNIKDPGTRAFVERNAGASENIVHKILADIGHE